MEEEEEGEFEMNESDDEEIPEDVKAQLRK